MHAAQRRPLPFPVSDRGIMRRNVVADTNKQPASKSDIWIAVCMHSFLLLYSCKSTSHFPSSSQRKVTDSIFLSICLSIHLSTLRGTHVPRNRQRLVSSSIPSCRKSFSLPTPKSFFYVKCSRLISSSLCGGAFQHLRVASLAFLFASGGLRLISIA
jgi:hypothetical protein